LIDIWNRYQYSSSKHRIQIPARDFLHDCITGDTGVDVYTVILIFNYHIYDKTLKMYVPLKLWSSVMW